MPHRPPVAGRRAVLATAVSAGYLLPAFLFERALARSARYHPPSRKAVLMLDPGHGGKDPGAIGISGTYEKHVALDTAFELRRQLESTGRYHVLMTRATDIFVPLDERVARAQARGATLFVSMHADALPHDPRVRGASVYTPSRIASDPLSAQLARTENAADRLGPAYRHRKVVESILDSLTVQETRTLAARMAHDVVGAFAPTIPLLENPARHADFEVLKSADIPSVLVEMGFMSNLADEAALRRPAHRAQVAAAMRRAIDAYFATASRLIVTEG